MVDQEHEESFAELFAQSQQQERRRVSPGEKVTGTVVQVGAERVIVDLGDGLDGLADLGELSERGEESAVKKGDRIELYVTRIENRVAILAKSIGKGPGARLALEEAARTGVPVEGLVAEVNKGGYVVEAAGMRCFCPMGQMDTRRIEDPKTMIGQRLQFQVAEMRGTRDVVLSRRSLLEADAAQKAAKTRQRLEVGARFTGTVTGVRDFGCFVDIGGLEGLVPASELGYGRQRPTEVVHAGQTVEVEVLRIEPPGPKDRTERLTLSMRALAADPWEVAIEDLTEGDIVKGIVQRTQPFGAFVEIVPGVDGLLHVSAFGKRVGHPSEMVAPGDEIAVRIEGVDREQRRLSLSYVTPEDLAGIVGELAPEAVAPAPAAAPVVEAAPAPAAVPEKKALSAVGQHEGGMKLRRTEKPGAPAAPKAAPKVEPKVEAKPAAKIEVKPAAVTAPATKPRVLGRSAMADRPVEAVTPGTAPGAQRPGRRAEELAAPPVGTVLDVTVDKHEIFGMFVKWAGGRGLLPATELETPKNADLRKAYPVGTVLKAAVIEVRGDGKVRLSATAATQADERNEARAWMQTQKPAGGKGFGTMADLLAKFKK